MSTTAVIRRRRILLQEVAHRLAHAIEHGDTQGIERWQAELARFEKRSPRTS